MSDSNPNNYNQNSEGNEPSMADLDRYLKQRKAKLLRELAIKKREVEHITISRQLTIDAMETVLKEKEEESDPVMEENDPVMEKSGPVMEKSDPVMRESGPVMEKSNPVMEESDPVMEENDPVMEKNDPVTVGSYSVTKESDPVMEKSDPVMRMIVHIAKCNARRKE